MSGSASYDEASVSKYGEPYKVNLVVATEDTLKGYGTIVRDFDKAEVEITPWPVTGWRKLYPGTGTMGGVVHGNFTCEWEGDVCKVVNHAVDKHFVTGRLPSGVSFENRTHVLVREANYHPDGGQVFYPRDKDPFIALLALPGDDVKPESFVAFYFDGSYGVQIHANVWHQSVYPIKDRAVYLGKQGAVYACVNVDTVEEWGKHLLVPLTL